MDAEIDTTKSATSTQESAVSSVAPISHVVQPDPVIVATTNLSTTLSDSASIADTASQDKVDYETKRLNDAIEGYNQAIPIKADFSALKDAQARAQALLDQAPALGIARIPPREMTTEKTDVIVNGFDISSYATDPFHEQKIRGIIYALPPFTTPDALDVYIQTFFSGSPVTGAMIFASAKEYGVDIPLMVAIMQNDSGFGTLGVGAVTYNPGNVGNTGSATHTYPSWAEGVSAVANWLNTHRAIVPAPQTEILQESQPQQPQPQSQPINTPVPESLPPLPSITSTTTEPTVLPSTSEPTVGAVASSSLPTIEALNSDAVMNTATTTPEIVTDASTTEMIDASTTTSVATSTES
jgi:hypothetical protein